MVVFTIRVQLHAKLFTIAYVTTRKGIVGNELADKAARQASSILPYPDASGNFLDRLRLLQMSARKAHYTHPRLDGAAQFALGMQ